MLALVVVGAILYFGSQHPKAKPTTPEVAVQPSSQPTSPTAVVTLNSEIIATPAAPDRRVLVTQGPALIATPSTSATPAKEEMASKALDNATKDHPWVNSLGMKFVPIPGTKVFFSIWDTRVQDFTTFVQETLYNASEGMWTMNKGWILTGMNWENPGFNQESAHPVVGVSWNDANAFCEWLTKKEHASGRLPQENVYRLPTDAEWSIAVGLDHETGDTPKDKNEKIKGVYPWGTQWPPPKGAGNFGGGDSPGIEGYSAGWRYTSPVGSFQANQFGLYDMSGNVWQWCEDWYDDTTKQARVLRGGSFSAADPDLLLSSRRVSDGPANRRDNNGFRCALKSGFSR